MTRNEGPSGGERTPGSRTLPQEDPGYYESLGRAIKVARTQQDLSRKVLAERAGVSYAYLSDIETGRGRPSSKALMAVAGALGRSPAELLQEAELYGAMRELSTPLPADPAPASPPPARAQSWFHVTPAAVSDVPARRPAAEVPSHAARTELQRLARSRLAGGVASDRDELHAAVDGLSDEDVRTVLQIARRLLAR